MHKISAYEARVFLFYKNGGRTTYASKSQALKILGQKFIRNEVGENFIQFSHREWPSIHWDSNGDMGPSIPGEVIFKHSNFIMRDEFGKTLTLADFMDLIHMGKEPVRSLYFYRFGYYCGEGPVPGTGKSRSHRGSYFKVFSSVPEMRQNQVIEADEPVARAQRNLHNLSSAWDDDIRKDRRNKNWKRFRKTQYK